MTAHLAAERPTADDEFIEHAYVAASRATCGRLHVGAILVRDDNILATGRNGAPRGVPHCTLHAVDEPCRRSKHAEENAVAFAARNGGGTLGATLYVTHSPCYDCAGLLINAGIVEVVYDQPYRDPAGLDLLATVGIPTRRHSP